jgi:ribosomal protein S9
MAGGVEDGSGPQAQVDAEHVAVGRALLQEPAQVVGDAHRHALRLDALGHRQGFSGA